MQIFNKIVGVAVGVVAIFIGIAIGVAVVTAVFDAFNEPAEASTVDPANDGSTARQLIVDGCMSQPGVTNEYCVCMADWYMEDATPEAQAVLTASSSEGDMTTAFANNEFMTAVTNCLTKSEMQVN